MQNLCPVPAEPLGIRPIEPVCYCETEKPTVFTKPILYEQGIDCLKAALYAAAKQKFCVIPPRGCQT